MTERTIVSGSLLGSLLELLPGKSTVKVERGQHAKTWEVTVTADFEGVHAKIVVVNVQLLRAIVEAERLVDELLDTATVDHRPGRHKLPAEEEDINYGETAE